MRWGVHWRVAKAALKDRRSLAYQLGSVMPDWFETRPIHRWKESGKKFLDRAEKVRRMRRGWRRDYLMGTLAHYVCDYCTMAHNEEYFRFYRHRVYEVLAQNCLNRRCREDRDWFEGERSTVPAVFRDPGTDDVTFREALTELVTEHTDALHGRIGLLQTAGWEWFRDERVAELDIREGWHLTSALVQILEQPAKRGKEK